MPSEEDLRLLQSFLWADLDRAERFEEWGTFDDYYAQAMAYLAENGEPQPSLLPQFFARFPQLLMPLGFDEYYLHHSDNEPAHALSRRIGRATVALHPVEPCFRRPTGEWLHFAGFDGDGLLTFHGASSSQHFGIEELVAALKRNAGEASYWLGASWTPSVIDSQRLLLRSSAVPLLKRLQEEQVVVDAITPRELELVVAELLRAEGYDVIVTESTRDGGRDVLARARVGRDNIYMAVEVKKRPRVNVGDLRAALYANARYAALMVVTSGRFASGVREALKRENVARLYLRDRAALAQMIASYTDDGEVVGTSKSPGPAHSWPDEIRRLVPPDVLAVVRDPRLSAENPRNYPVVPAKIGSLQSATPSAWLQPVSAYVLIQTDECNRHVVARAVRETEGVTQAHVVTGPYDLIAHADAVDQPGLAQLFRRVTAIPNVTRVMVCPTTRSARLLARGG